jgi:hypothetical protein
MTIGLSARTLNPASELLKCIPSFFDCFLKYNNISFFLSDHLFKKIIAGINFFFPFVGDSALEL